MVRKWRRNVLGVLINLTAKISKTCSKRDVQLAVQKHWLVVALSNNFAQRTWIFRLTGPMKLMEISNHFVTTLLLLKWDLDYRRKIILLSGHISINVESCTNFLEARIEDTAICHITRLRAKFIKAFLNRLDDCPINGLLGSVRLLLGFSKNSLLWLQSRNDSSA